MAVLTADYQRLDFVLFDPQLQQGRGKPASALRVIPRRLGLDRLHDSAGRVPLRALRRFSWTETDGLAQWEKLRSAFAIGEWSEEYFDNRGLFADYYLKERLRELPQWTDPAFKEARHELGQRLREARREFRSAPPPQFRSEFIEPLLDRLGFQFRAVEATSTAGPGRPHYELLDPASGERLAVCLAYHWDRFLDGPDPQDPDSPADNPGTAVLDLLADENTPWALVTNGKHWRLYTRKTESRATSFYQVDAEEAAADTDPDAFRYFWLLFRAQAFTPQPLGVEGQTREASFLEQLLEGSRDYAKQVGERLKQRVFQDIFPLLAEGFIEQIRARDGGEAGWRC